MFASGLLRLVTLARSAISWYAWWIRLIEIAGVDPEHPRVPGLFVQVVAVADGQWGLPVMSLVSSVNLLVGYGQQIHVV